MDLEKNAFQILKRMVYYMRQKNAMDSLIDQTLVGGFAMNAILGWLSALLSQLLPSDIYSRLDFLYNGTIICLGAGIIVMLIAVVFMIAAVRRSKRRALNA